jgi:hypothetical protein
LRQIGSVTAHHAGIGNSDGVWVDVLAESYEKCKESAILIAAAPELLEALEHIMACCYGFSEVIENQAHALIARAKGDA